MCVKHSKGPVEPTPPFTSLFLDQPADRGLEVTSVNTVLGPVDARRLGVTLVSESLLYVLPGAQYAYDIRIDRADVFDAIAAKLTAFKAAGGGTIVDATGMFQGRDLRLYEALSRSTGVHIVASTGQGPEAMLGGYFLTPQTNPPAPWPAAKFAEMFGREVNEGMVVPRFERRAPAGMIATAVTASGMTPTDGSLVRGAARAGATYGVPVLIRSGSDALVEMQLALDETLRPQRVVMAGMDRRDAVAKGWPMAVARAGARLAIDHIGSNDALHLDDNERVALVPYKASSAAIVDVLSQRVSFFIDVTPVLAPQVRDGALRALAVSTKKRLPALPTVPTLAERGLPDYEMFSWDGMFAPRGTPADRLEKLHEAVQTVLRNPEFNQRMMERGVVLQTMSRGDFSAMVLREYARMGAVVKQLGVSID